MSEKRQIPTAVAGLEPDFAERLATPFIRFARLEASGGIILVALTLAAMGWANSAAGHSYVRVFEETIVSVGVGSWGLSKPLILWINDLLMAGFFLLVGLEIKREILVGELSSPRKAALPIFAAIGGMVGPAGIYAVINRGEPSIHGWGVPMATDIAFAIGMLALAGPRASTSLRIFLTTFAIADDLGALLIIALFYTDELRLEYLSLAGAVLAMLIALNAMRVRAVLPYALLGLVLWYFVLKTGIHATIAGVAMAMTIPARARVDADRFVSATRKTLEIFERAGDHGSDARTNPVQRAAARAISQNCKLVLPPAHRMEEALFPWVFFLVVPVFALANAGVPVGGEGGGSLRGPILPGVVLGLFIGKPVGIVVASWLGVRLGLAALPAGVTWRQITAAGFLGGIGFTMSLFIAHLAFADPAHLAAAKIGVLGGSAISCAVGLAVLFTSPRPSEPHPR
jgi:NhaA family Na+:H+ antiporter